MNTDTFTVNGSLRHHFHGIYSATIAIACGTVPPAQVVAQLPQGTKSTVHQDLILLRSDGADYEDLVQWIEDHRVDGDCYLFDCCDGKPRHPIDSVAHSIDHGPTFTLQLPFVDLHTPQLPFKEAAK